MNPIYKCPVCDNSLDRNEKSLVCKLGHTFDISKDGYVNPLVLPEYGSPIITNRICIINPSLFDIRYDRFGYVFH